jgi:glycosyltransferase involved in cell wall biosynthesis
MSATDLTMSVVIPVYNEADFLANALEKLYGELGQVDAAVDVILAENGSTDGTAELGRRLSEKYPALSVLELPEPDYGGAMRAGFLAATGDWVVNSDIDYFSGAFLARVVAEAAEADVVLASKRDPESDDRRSPVRRLATWAFNKVLRIMLGSKVSDTHGIKALRREVIEDVAADVISRQDLFDTELVIRAEKQGWRIKELPIVVEEQRVAKSNLLSRVPRTLRGVWRIRRALRS